MAIQFLKKENIQQFLHARDATCMTVYLPRPGRNTGKKGNEIANILLEKTAALLERHGLQKQEIDAFLEPVDDALSEKDFWVDQGKCLLVLARTHFQKFFFLPFKCFPFSYVGDEFYLLPVLNMFSKEVQSFMPVLGRDDVSIDLNDVMPAAANGQVKALFLRKDTDRYGYYDKINSTLIINGVKRSGDASLHNTAAIETWRHGGQVYLLEAEKMPVPGTFVNAVMR